MNYTKRRDMTDLIEDIVKYHYTNQEHFFVEDLIKHDKKFAEAVYFELQMQLYIDDCDEKETLLLED